MTDEDKDKNKAILAEALRKSQEVENKKIQANREFEALKRGQEVLQQQHLEEELPGEQEVQKQIEEYVT